MHVLERKKNLRSKGKEKKEKIKVQQQKEKGKHWQTVKRKKEEKKTRKIGRKKTRPSNKPSWPDNYAGTKCIRKKNKSRTLLLTGAIGIAGHWYRYIWPCMRKPWQSRTFYILRYCNFYTLLFFTYQTQKTDLKYLK